MSYDELISEVVLVRFRSLAPPILLLMAADPPIPPRPPVPPRSFSSAVSGSSTDPSKSSHSSSIPPPIPPKVPLPGQGHSGAVELGSVSTSSFFAKPATTTTTQRTRAATAPSYSSRAALPADAASSRDGFAHGGVIAASDEILDLDDDSNDDQLGLPPRPARQMHHQKTYGSSNTSRGRTVSQFRPAVEPVSPEIRQIQHKSLNQAPDVNVGTAINAQGGLEELLVNDSEDELLIEDYNDDSREWSRQRPQRDQGSTRSWVREGNAGNEFGTSMWDADTPPDEATLRLGMTHGGRAGGMCTAARQGLAGEGINAGWTAPKIVEIRNPPLHLGGVWGDFTAVDFDRVEDLPESAFAEVPSGGGAAWKRPGEFVPTTMISTSTPTIAPGESAAVPIPNPTAPPPSYAAAHIKTPATPHSAQASSGDDAEASASTESAANDDVTMREQSPAAPAPLSPSSQPSTATVTATAAATTAISDEGPRDPPKSDVPIPGFSIVTRQELDEARPHRDMYFCFSTFSWVLFSPLEVELGNEASAPPPGSTTVPLWHVVDARGDELAFELKPPMQPKFPPAYPGQLSKNALYQSEEGLGPLGPDDLVAIESTTALDNLGGGIARVVFSPSTSFYPAVIPSHVWHKFIDSKRQDPMVGLTPDQAALKAVNSMFQALSNLLFKGEVRAMPIKYGKGFTKTIGWNDISRDIFLGILGFRLTSDGEAITPPDIDERTEQGRLKRLRCIRCWLELAIWIEHFVKLRRDEVAKIKLSCPTRIRLIPAGPRLLEALQYHLPLPTVPSTEVWETKGGNMQEAKPELGLAYHRLGLTPDLSDDVVVNVYEQHIAQWPHSITLFFSALSIIYEDRQTETLQMCVARERSQDRYTESDLFNAYRELRLGGPADLIAWRGLDDDVIMDAFQRRSDDVSHPERRRVLTSAMALVARDRNSDLLKTIVESAGDAEDGSALGLRLTAPTMDLAQAYRALELPDGTPADLAVSIYEQAIKDAPQRKTTLTEALRVIGEHQKSEEVRRLLAGETDPNAGWESALAIDKDMPVGLTNIANTCYLNSLLQYFFTIRELRETILQFSKQDHPTLSTDRDTANRVGGRLVTAAEIERSRRFVELLQGLFSNLISAPVTAVTPETELAYLALVPPKDEDTFQQRTAASATADANNKELPLEPAIESTSAASTVAIDSAYAVDDEMKSPSVLGKRRNDQLEDETDLISLDPMVIESASPMSVPGPDSYVGANKASIDTPSSPSATRQNDRSTKRGRSVDDTAKDTSEELIDVDGIDVAQTTEKTSAAVTSALATQEDEPMPLSEAPPLPPRPSVDNKGDLEKQVSSYMSFGRQNDVTECMDNVMFQIECALEPGTSQEQNKSASDVLKRIFYGKTRQELVFMDSQAPEPVRAKEEPFFSLLVDVAEEGRDVYDGLDAVFDDSPVVIEGKQARRRVSLVEVPDLLQIQLQRVQYDREKQKIFKSNQHMAFGPQISMDRYLQAGPDDEAGQQRKEATSRCREEMDACRAKLRDLQSPKGLDISKTLRQTYDHLSDQPDLKEVLTTELAEDTLREASDLQDEIETLGSRIRELKQKIEEIWAQQHRAEYELVSVFIHRGTALSGHYFIYQRDSTNTSRWLKYNDAVVTPVDPNEHVFKETTGDTNAYFLVYCRKDRLNAIESIARRV